MNMISTPLNRFPWWFSFNLHLLYFTKNLSLCFSYFRLICCTFQFPFRFTSLVDYQYLAPKELQNAFSHVSTSSLMEEKQPLHIIPPIFSRIDAQGSYNYQPETAKRAGSRNNPLHVVNPVEEDWKKWVLPLVYVTIFHGQKYFMYFLNCWAIPWKGQPQGHKLECFQTYIFWCFSNPQTVYLL